MRAMMITIGALTTIIGGYAVIQFGLLSYSYRYKITLIAEVSGQEKVAAGVIEVISRQEFIPGQATRYHPKTVGQAIELNLGENGPVFLLISGPYGVPAGILAPRAFEEAQPKDLSRPPDTTLSRREWLEKLSKAHAKTAVQLNLLPPIVRFRDITDPNSVEPVMPESFESAFGPGVKLVSVILQFTDEPISIGIKKTLPWLTSPDFINDRQKGKLGPFSNSISSLDFKSNI